MITKMFSRLSRNRLISPALLRDNRGAAAVTLAFSLTGIVGMAGLATEASNWYLTSRRMQSAADSVAFSTAISLSTSDSWSNAQIEGKSVASTAYGFTDGSNGVTITLTNPYNGDSTAVEAVISQPQTPLLSALFLNTGPTITARAAAKGNVSSGCVLALNRSNVVDLTDSGNVSMNLTSCAVYVNSDDSGGALTMNGNVTINASGVYVTGGISQGQGTINDNGNTHTGSPPINDPYANVPVPSTTTLCPQVVQNSVSVGTSGDVNLNSSTPATLANPTGTCLLSGPDGLSLGAQASLTLAPGIYIIDGTNGGSLSVGAQSTLSGDGVTIVLTGSTSGSPHWATATINAGATVNISAPTSGSTKGLAIMQDRNAPNCTGSSCNKIAGGGSQNITGAIYFPNQALKFAGNSSSSSGGSTCTQLVGYELDFTGTSNLSTSGCGSAGTTAFGSPTATMVM